MAHDYRVYGKSMFGAVFSVLTSVMTHKRADGTSCTAETAIRENASGIATLNAKIGTDSLEVGSDIIDGINTVNSKFPTKIDGANCTFKKVDNLVICSLNQFVVTHGMSFNIPSGYEPISTRNSNIVQAIDGMRVLDVITQDGTMLGLYNMSGQALNGTVSGNLFWLTN